MDADAISRSLQDIADQMASVSLAMVDLAEGSDCSLALHGLELLGAAQICREWAESIAGLDISHHV